MASVVVCCNSVSFCFKYSHYGYFAGTGSNYCPDAIDATWKNMGLTNHIIHLPTYPHQSKATQNWFVFAQDISVDERAGVNFAYNTLTQVFCCVGSTLNFVNFLAFSWFNEVLESTGVYLISSKFIAIRKLFQGYLCDVAELQWVYFGVMF